MDKTQDPDLERRSVDELIGWLVGGPESSVVARAGGLVGLARADPFELAQLLDDGKRRPAARFRAARSLAAAFELGRRAEVASAAPPTLIASPADVAAWAKPRLGGLTHEELWMLGLDGRGRLRAVRCVARGGLHGAAVRSSDPVRAALRVDATGFVLVHNHPSGDPTPSAEDIRLTAEVSAAAATVGVPLLDHVVVTRNAFACVPTETRVE